MPEDEAVQAQLMGDPNVKSLSFNQILLLIEAWGAIIASFAFALGNVNVPSPPITIGSAQYTITRVK